MLLAEMEKKKKGYEELFQVFLVFPDKDSLNETF